MKYTITNRRPTDSYQSLDETHEMLRKKFDPEWSEIDRSDPLYVISNVKKIKFENRAYWYLVEWLHQNKSRNTSWQPHAGMPEAILNDVWDNSVKKTNPEYYELYQDWLNGEWTRTSPMPKLLKIDDNLLLTPQIVKAAFAGTKSTRKKTVAQSKTKESERKTKTVQQSETTVTSKARVSPKVNKPATQHTRTLRERPTV
ncbi:hypothetical protein HDU99_007113, partial [Rhizoclosmatium hyalinum]